ncbi:MAG: hypothetical protein QOH93_1708, partial [Chloroflexia bacterium]|nr:hypothetical protein [Chloroflexia bacterium]
METAEKSAPVSPEAENYLATAHRYEKNGWIAVHVEGAPFARGYQHGYLLAAEIEDALRVARFLALWDTGEEFDTFILAAQQVFEPKIEAEYLQEIQGIAAGVAAAGINLTFNEILAWNAYQELLGNWWPNRGG